MTLRGTAPRRLPGWVYGGTFGCLIIMSWMGWNRYRPPTEGEIQQLAGYLRGERGLQILRDADRLYATPVALRPGGTGDGSTASFEAVAEPVPVSDSDRLALQQLLLSPRSYATPRPGVCSPDYLFRLHFIRGEQALDVWVSLDCSQIRFVVDGQESQAVSFWSIRQELAQIAIQMFPAEPRIRSAAEKSL